MDERLLALFKENGIALLLGVIGLGFLAYGVFTMVGTHKTDPGIQFQPSDHPSDVTVASAAAKQAKKLTIDVEGAVEKPGVYTLPPDSRVQDALIAAGGMSKDADRTKVSQTLNLASSLADGGKLYIPTVGEQMVPSGGTSTTSSGTSNSVLGTQTKVININTASSSELDALPGVGPVTAQKIIDNRPYQSTQELVSKKAVGQSEFEKIKDSVSVN